MFSGTSEAIDHANPINWAHPINRGCVAWWLGLPGNAGGMKLHDLTSPRDWRIGRHATLAGATLPSWVPGSANRPWPVALSFDGSSSNCTLTADNSIASLAKFSIFSWNYPKAFGSAGVSKGIYGKSATSGFSYTGTKIDFISTSNHPGATILSTNTWYLAGYTYDGTTLKGYFNGKQDYSSAVSVTLPANGATIGSNGGAVQFYNGLIQDVKIWNRALSPDEILFMNANGPAGYPDVLNRIGGKFNYGILKIASSGQHHLGSLGAGS